MWKDFLIENVDELCLLGRGRVVDTMRDKNGPETRHGESAWVEALLEICLLLHVGDDTGDERERWRVRVSTVKYITARSCGWKCSDKAQGDRCLVRRA